MITDTTRTDILMPRLTFRTSSNVILLIVNLCVLSLLLYSIELTDDQHQNLEPCERNRRIENNIQNKPFTERKAVTQYPYGALLGNWNEDWDELVYHIIGNINQSCTIANGLVQI